MINGSAHIGPDRPTLDTFVGSLFRYADEGTTIALRAFVDGKRNEPALFTNWARIGDPRTSDWVFNSARRAAEHEDPGNFCPPVCTFVGQDKADKAAIANGVALTVECDARPVECRRVLTLLLGEPTVITASGGEWSNPDTGEIEPKLHLHWRLAEPTRDQDGHNKLEEARRLACAHVGADASAVPINHPLRWPGSVHRKGAPRLARIVLQTENEVELADVLDKLRAVVPAEQQREARQRSVGAGLGFGPDLTGDALDIAAALAEIPNADLPWDEWRRIAMATQAAGGTFAAFDAWSAKSGKYDTAATADCWDHVCKHPASNIGAGTLFYLAQQASPGWRKPSSYSREQRLERQGDQRQDDRQQSREQPSGDWKEPLPLPRGLLPVDSFDPDVLPDAIAPWVQDISDRMQCPPDFVAVSAMVGLAAVLGRKIAVRPQAQTDWQEVPNLWGCIVGRPGAMKSPAMSEALKPLSRLEAEARKANEDDMAGYRQAMIMHKVKLEVAQANAKAAMKKGEHVDRIDVDEPEKPEPKRYLTNDSTYEALGAMMAANPNGVLVFRDELVSLLKTLDREEYAAARGFYLSAWNGTGGYTFDRIVRGLTHVDAVCASLLGSTQPGRLAEYLSRAVTGSAGDDGLIQRFGLLVWPDDNGAWKEVDRYPDTAARENAVATFVHLERLSPEAVEAEQGPFDSIPHLRFDDAAREAFSGWRHDLEGRLKSGTMHAVMESHLSKYRKLLPALALINHLADRKRGPVGLVAVQRAMAFAEYLESHARRAYASGTQNEVSTASAILTHIRKGDIEGEFTARDILRKEWSNLGHAEGLAKGLELLDDLNWIAARDVKTGGRPKTVYTINPRGVR